MKHWLILIFFSLSLFACKRKGEPVPAICTSSLNAVGDVLSMKSTDTLTLVNCSKKYTNIRWVMPDGGTSSNETVYFVPSGVGTFQVRLYASNDKFVNEYETSAKIVVTP